MAGGSPMTEGNDENEAGKSWRGPPRKYFSKSFSDGRAWFFVTFVPFCEMYFGVRDEVEQA